MTLIHHQTKKKSTADLHRRPVHETNRQRMTKEKASIDKSLSKVSHNPTDIYFVWAGNASFAMLRQDKMADAVDVFRLHRSHHDGGSLCRIERASKVGTKPYSSR